MEKTKPKSEKIMIKQNEKLSVLPLLYGWSNNEPRFTNFVLQNALFDFLNDKF